MERDELLELINQAAREGWNELDLRNQGITELSPEIGCLATLEVLRLGYVESIPGERNDLTDLPPEIGRLTALQELYLGGNQLVTLPPELFSLISLRYLDLSENKLATLSTGIGQLTALQHLDLHSNILTALPSVIGQLVALQSLNLHGNRLTVLPPEIGQLTSLEDFSVRYNHLAALPPEIGHLTSLRSLSLSANRLASLPPEIGRLTALQSLDLGFNQLTDQFPSDIGQLANLQLLDLWNNGLTVLPLQIMRLTNLRKLYLGDNNLAALPPEIGQLTALQSLNLWNNYLASLPPEIGQLTALQKLDLRRNSNFPLPLEILENHNDPQAIIRAYLDYLAGKTCPLNEVKLVLVGEGSVGKTSLVNRLLYDMFNPSAGKTEGIAIHKWQIADGEPANERINQTVTSNEQPVTSIQCPDSSIRINVWDFGGQEIMHATHQFFLTKRTLYILVLDNRLSEAENRLDYWLTLIRGFGGDSPIIIVGNKTDQHGLDLNRRDLLAKYPTVQAILETSCATGEGIAALREAITAQIAKLPHVADPLLNTWFEVKAQLETMEADHIPYSHYVELCCAKNVDNPDSQRVLLGFLHDLGVVLHFPDPRLETTNILNPEWVTQGVYRILNTRLPFEEQGILTWDMLARILDDEPYREKRMFVVDMMQKFELCYELPDRKDTFLIPDLLPKEEPDTGAWNDALAFEVHYPVLPGSILTRLIVRMHRHIKERIVWRTGVLLACDGNEALVRADLTANRITIAVRGPGSGRRELLTRIREHLEAIHSSLAGLEAAEKVPVPDYLGIQPVDYRWLRDMEREGIETFLPPGLTKLVHVRQLLDGVEPPEARRKREPGYTAVNIYGGQVGVIGSDTDVNSGIHFSNQTE